MSCLVTKLNGSIEDPTGRLKNFKSISGNFYSGDRNIANYNLFVEAIASESNPFIITTGNGVTINNNERADLHTYCITDTVRHTISITLSNPNIKSPNDNNSFTINNKYLMRYFVESWFDNDPGYNTNYFINKNNVVHFNTASDFYGLKNLIFLQIGTFNDDSLIDLARLKNDYIDYDNEYQMPPFTSICYGDLNKIKINGPCQPRFALYNHRDNPLYFSDVYSAEVTNNGTSRLMIINEDGVPIIPAGTDLSRLNFIQLTFTNRLAKYKFSSSSLHTDGMLKSLNVYLESATDIDNFIMYLNNHDLAANHIFNISGDRSTMLWIDGEYTMSNSNKTALNNFLDKFHTATNNAKYYFYINGVCIVNNAHIN